MTRNPDASLTAPARQRTELASRLSSDGDHDLASILEACGEEMWLVCTQCGFSHATEARCKKRWCPVCVREGAARLAAKYTLHVERMQWPLFVSGSCKNFDSLTVDPFHYMLRSFYKLRKQRWFKRQVRGGVVGTEVTNTGRGWHPHFHAVMDCRWFAPSSRPPHKLATAATKKAAFTQAKQEAREAWETALGRPGSLEVKRAYASTGRNSSPIAYEILKYAVKGSDLIESDDPPGDLIRLMEHRRLARAWGSCYGQVTAAELDTDRQSKCPQCHAPKSQVPAAVAKAMMRFSR